MPIAKKKSSLIPNLATIGFFILVIPVMAAIAGSLWVTATAVYENVKFARATEQLLALIVISREEAAKNPDFGRQENEDIIGDLTRSGLYTSHSRNPWDGSVRVTATGVTSLLRIETDLPARACRRFAIYFGKEANNVGLQKMEAREANSGWRPFYNASNDRINVPGFLAINAACGNSESDTLALMLRLR